VARLGQAALVVPIKIKNEVVGLLVVMRKAAQPFNPSNQALLEAVADYASVSLANARLFSALEERAKMLQHAAESAQSSERAKDEALRGLAHKLSSMVNDLSESLAQVEWVQREAATKLSPEQTAALKKAQEHLQSVRNAIEAFVPRASLAATAPLGAPRQTNS
jgi:GAF domain-containing protein